MKRLICWVPMASRTPTPVTVFRNGKGPTG